MMEPIESEYFNWLCAKVMPILNHSPSNKYWNLLKMLHDTEFVWLVMGDDNRAADGLELRERFLIESGLPDDPQWRKMGCSVLEMLIGFSYRAEFTTSTPASDWFWEFLENLGLNDLSDAADIPEKYVHDVLDQFIWRTYDKYGNGGLFPIHKTRSDQRTIEVWYQFCEYLVDQNRLP
ncbi:MAG: hypothetical protein ABWY25_03575 [Paenisporosarcina sp.]